MAGTSRNECGANAASAEGFTSHSDFLTDKELCSDGAASILPPKVECEIHRNISPESPMSNERPDNPVFATIETRIAGQLQVRHEMRTSLNAIIGYSEMLRQEAHESGLEEFQGAFRQLHKASQRMLLQIGRAHV